MPPGNRRQPARASARDCHAAVAFIVTDEDVLRLVATD